MDGGRNGWMERRYCDWKKSGENGWMNAGMDGGMERERERERENLDGG